MHGSLWTFRGDPDELLRGFDGMLAEGPVERMRMTACLRTPDGILVIDTCPSREDWESFRTGAWFADALARHGLPQPEIADYPLERAVLEGRIVEGPAATVA